MGMENRSRQGVGFLVKQPEPLAGRFDSAGPHELSNLGRKRRAVDVQIVGQLLAGISNSALPASSDCWTR